MTGASGSFYSTGESVNTGEVRLIVGWEQTFNPGDTFSTITITAQLQRQYDTTYSLGGTWYAWATGGVSVNGTYAVQWKSRSTTAALSQAGRVGWSATGTVTVEHTGATTVPIKIDKINWNNTAYSVSSVTIAEKTETVTLAAITQPHTLSVTQGTGTSLTVNRTSSPTGGAETGVITDGATIYDGDTLQISATAASGYALNSLTVNGEGIASGDTITVSGDVSIVSTGKQQGLVYIDTGSGWEAYQAYIDNGTSWDMCAPYVSDGTNWNLMS